MVQRVFNRRVYITSFLILFVACLYIIKLFSLHFSDKIVLNSPYHNPELVRRGYITDRNGNILSMSIEKGSLYANPEHIEDPVFAAAAVSKILNIPKEKLYEKFTLRRRFIWIKRIVDDELISKVNSLGIKGIYVRKEFKRVYPNGELASNLIGFAGIDNRGLEGLEFKYNDVLNGDFDSKYTIEIKDFKYGNNLVLTVDRYIQYFSEKYLAETVDSFKARQGAVIVTEPKTGKILAYAKYPSYDPNKYYDYSRKEWKAFTISDSFEPGSTMKIFSVASVLKQNVYNPDEFYNCTGAVQIGDTVINDTGIHGKINLSEAVKHSCNVGIIMSLKKVSASRHYTTLRRFGFGEVTGCGIPGESSGILREVKRWSGLSKYSIGIGQEISVTSIQLAAAYGAIANGGIYIVPGIIERIDSFSGEALQNYFVKSRGRILTTKQSHILKNMLRGVVDGGTGRNAMSRYYSYAGKTGTAQKYIKSEGNYSSQYNIASFAGFAPFEDPQIVIIVIIDEPLIATGGGTVAAPLFKKIADKTLPYLGVTKRVIKNYSPEDKREKTNVRYSVLPDFSGENLIDGLYILADIQKSNYVTYSVDGYGTVVRQSPPPGTPIKNGMKVVLYAREKTDNHE